MFTGATLGLLFSYYRHPPLLISIKWLSLTLVLNSFLLAILWNERVEAEELGNDPEKASALALSLVCCCFYHHLCNRRISWLRRSIFWSSTNPPPGSPCCRRVGLSKRKNRPCLLVARL